MKVFEDTNKSTIISKHVLLASMSINISAVNSKEKQVDILISTKPGTANTVQLRCNFTLANSVYLSSASI